jgi:hypothetical protein
MSYEDTNVGLGMVPHRGNCRCGECRIDRLQSTNRALESRLSKAVAAIEGMLNALPSATTHPAIKAARAVLVTHGDSNGADVNRNAASADAVQK